MRPTPSSRGLLARSTRLLVFFLLSVLLSETVILPVAPVRAASTYASAVGEPFAIPRAPMRAPQSVLVSALPPERDMPSTFIAASNAYTMSAALESSHGPVTGFNGSFDAPGGKVVYRISGPIDLLPRQKLVIPLPIQAPTRLRAHVTFDLMNYNPNGFPNYDISDLFTVLQPHGTSTNDFNGLSFATSPKFYSTGSASMDSEVALNSSGALMSQPADLVFLCQPARLSQGNVHCHVSNIELLDDIPGWAYDVPNSSFWNKVAGFPNKTAVGSVSDGSMMLSLGKGFAKWRTHSSIFRLPSLKAGTIVAVRFKHKRSSPTVTDVNFSLINLQNPAVVVLSLGNQSLNTTSWSLFTWPAMPLTASTAATLSQLPVQLRIQTSTSDSTALTFF